MKNFHTPIITFCFKDVNVIIIIVLENFTRKEKMKNKTALAYLMIFLVLLIWSVSPLLNALLNEKCSVALRTAITGALSVLVLLLLCRKKLKKINVSYIKWAVPTGVFIALASLVQKIGLLYTTPTKYAFLENLSCVVVPIILFFAISKKPNFLTIISSVLCLVGSFVLSGMNFNGESLGFGKGEILCALSGVLYAFNIAYTGICIKKFDTMLYLLIQQMALAISSLIFAVLFSVIKINGAPIEKLKFTFDLEVILIIIILSLVSNLLCWCLRTYSMKFVNPTAVAVIMPFSAVITGVLSVLFKMDTISIELVLGGVISLLAVVLSSIADICFEKNDFKKKIKSS